MPPPRFGEAFDQRQCFRFEEDHAQVVTLRAQALDDFRQVGKAFAAARVDGDRDTGMPFAPQMIDQRPQHGQRQVVHAVVAAVLEHRDRDAFAGTGQA